MKEGIEHAEEQKRNWYSRAGSWIAGKARSVKNAVVDYGPGVVKGVSKSIAVGMAFYGFFNIFATEFNPSPLLFLATGGGIAIMGITYINKQKLKMVRKGITATKRVGFQSSLAFALESAIYQLATQRSELTKMSTPLKVGLPGIAFGTGLATTGMIYRMKNQPQMDTGDRTVSHALIDMTQLTMITTMFSGDNLNIFPKWTTPATAGVLLIASSANQIAFSDKPNARRAGEAVFAIFGFGSLAGFLYANCVDIAALLNNEEVSVTVLGCMAIPAGLFFAYNSGREIYKAYQDIKETNVEFHDPLQKDEEAAERIRLLN